MREALRRVKVFIKALAERWQCVRPAVRGGVAHIGVREGGKFVGGEITSDPKFRELVLLYLMRLRGMRVHC